MLAQRSARARVGLAVASIALLAALPALLSPVHRPAVRPPVAAPVPVQLPDSLVLGVRYAGLGGEGVDLVWRGQGGGEAPGRATIRVEYAGAPAERGMPVWPVNAWLFYSADDPRRSFAAELSGSMNWRTGQVRVTGLVSDGARVGTPLEQRMRVQHPDLAGHVVVRFLSPLALLGVAR